MKALKITVSKFFTHKTSSFLLIDMKSGRSILIHNYWANLRLKSVSAALTCYFLLEKNFLLPDAPRACRGSCRATSPSPARSNAPSAKWRWRGRARWVACRAPTCAWTCWTSNSNTSSASSQVSTVATAPSACGRRFLRATSAPSLFLYLRDNF